MSGEASELDALRYMLTPPYPDDVKRYQTEAEGAHTFARELGVLLAGGWGVGVDMANWLCGFENLMVLEHDQPRFFAELLGMIHNWNQQRMAVVLSGNVDLYIYRAWYEGCDFLSPKLFREVILPHLKSDAALAHEHGAKFGYICSSGILPRLDDYVEAGVDVLIGVDPVQGTHTDLGQIKNKAAGRLCLWGGVSGAVTVEMGEEIEIRAAVQVALAGLGPEGFILSPIDNITVDAPKTWCNLRIFIDEWHGTSNRKNPLPRMSVALPWQVLPPQHSPWRERRLRPTQQRHTPSRTPPPPPAPRTTKSSRRNCYGIPNTSSSAGPGRQSGGSTRRGRALGNGCRCHAKPMRVVVAGAHPDDPESGCGGTIARLSDAGHEVVILYLTRGERGIQGKTYDEAGRIRTAEAQKACEILKARPVFAGQVNGKVEVNYTRYDEYLKILEGERPDAVFTHWPIDTHEDHRATSLLVYDAWLRMQRKFALYYFEVMTGMQTSQFWPTHYVDITATEARKRASCFVHASQKPEEFYAVHDQMNRCRGMELGVNYAEAFIHHAQSPEVRFLSRRKLRLSVALTFRSAPAPPSPLRAGSKGRRYID